MTCSILNLTKVCTEEKNIRGSLRFKYLKLGVFKQFSPVVMNTGQSWLRIKQILWGEELGKKRCASVYRSLPLQGFRERLSPNSLAYRMVLIMYHIQDNGELIQVIYCVLCFRQPKEHVGVSVCDVGRVRLRNELCKHLCYYFFLCSFSIQLHKLFYTENIQVISSQLYQEVQ